MEYCFCRYLVFYTPFDIGYSVSKFLPVKLVFSVMKEIYRYVNVNFIVYEVNLIWLILFYSCKKVHDGVLHAAKLYPNAYIIMVIIGTLKGMKIVDVFILLSFLVTVLEINISC